jgi:hypothetical protein
VGAVTLCRPPLVPAATRASAPGSPRPLATRGLLNPFPHPRRARVISATASAAPADAAPRAALLGDATRKVTFHLACPICQTTAFDVPASSAP